MAKSNHIDQIARMLTDDPDVINEIANSRDVDPVAQGIFKKVSAKIDKLLAMGSRDMPLDWPAGIIMDMKQAVADVMQYYPGIDPSIIKRVGEQLEKVYADKIVAAGFDPVFDELGDDLNDLSVDDYEDEDMGDPTPG